MIEWIKLALMVASFIGNIAVFIYVRADRQQRATVKSITELKESVDQRFANKCERLTRLEAEVSRIPTRAEYETAQRRVEECVVRIHDRIEDISRINQQSIREISLQLGDVLGQLKQINKGIPHG